MRPPVAALVLSVLAVGCGGAHRGIVDTAGPTSSMVLVVTPTQEPAPPTTETTAAEPATVAKEGLLPAGARHGDQADTVEHFAAIDNTDNCDTLRAERDADRAARDVALAQRDTVDGARAQAEMAGRWMDAASKRMRQLRCPQPMAVTP